MEALSSSTYSDIPAWPFAALAFFVGLLIIAFKLGDWHRDVNRDRKAFGEWSEDVNQDRSEFKKFMEEIRGKIQEILNTLNRSPVLSSGSPLQLTDKGQTIAKQISAEKWAAELGQNIMEDIETDISNKSPYEIQEFCFKHVYNREFSTDRKDLINNCAYQNGVRFEAVLNVLAIVLRDILLQLTGQPVPE